MIHLRGVGKSFETRKKVLDQITLDMKKGEFLYVLGGTGAGKSTLLKLLATEEAPSAGQLSLFGYDVATASANMQQAIRQSIGYIPQNVRLLSDFTVFENVALGVSYGGARVLRVDVRNRIFEILERLQLINLRDVPASRLSGGEAQRVAVARALARQPELIVADEPTGAQDQSNTWGLMDLFQRSNISGTTIVLATHDKEIVRRVRKRCALLNAGRMVFEDGFNAHL